MAARVQRNRATTAARSAAGKRICSLLLLHCISAAAMAAARRIWDAAIEMSASDTLPARSRKLRRCGQFFREEGKRRSCQLGMGGP